MKRHKLHRAVAFFIAFVMLLGALTGLYVPVYADSSPVVQENAQEYVHKMQSLQPLEEGLFTYTVHIANELGGASAYVWNPATSTRTDFGANVGGFRTATITSPEARLSLRIGGYGGWATPFERDFVVTAEHNNVYMFPRTGGDVLGLVYAVPRLGGYVDFTLISWDSTMRIGATGHPMLYFPERATALGNLLPDGSAASGHFLYTSSVNWGAGQHTFRLSRGTLWPRDGLYARVYIPTPPPPPGYVPVTINYLRRNENYAGWDMWAFTTGSGRMLGDNPRLFSATNIPMGGYAWAGLTLQVTDDTCSINFYARPGHWGAGRSPQIHASLNICNETGVTLPTTLYYIHGDLRAFNEFPYLGLAVQAVLADWDNWLRVTMNMRPSQLPDANLFVLRNETTEESFTPSAVRWVYGTPPVWNHTQGGYEATSVTFHLDFPRHTLVPYEHFTLRYGGQTADIATDVVMRNILDRYHTTERQGLWQDGNNFNASIWAPTAYCVQLVVYSELRQGFGTDDHFTRGNTGNGSVRQDFLRNPANYTTHEMYRDADTGMWSLVTPLPISVANQWYMFRVEQPNGDVQYAVDPWATAVSMYGQLGAIITDAQRGRPLRDENGLNRLQRGEFLPGANPDIVRMHNGTASQVDHIIYQTHVRDFTLHPSSGVTNPGTFLGVVERGTHVPGHPDVSTGIDHLLELGITTVYFLPLYDQANINEATDRRGFNVHGAFNWGFDPLHFNVPEGAFSTRPDDPANRIEEMKYMIDQLHAHGIRVVLDVVYNHTASITGSPFHHVVPGYFHRSWCNGLFSDGAGVGNEVASERPMVRQYIVDSLLFWQREFGVDGFRFDLMGLHDAETMFQAVEALRAVDPNVIIYGEPWVASTTPLHFANYVMPGHLHNYPFVREGLCRASGGNGVHWANHWAVASLPLISTPNWHRDVGPFGFFNDRTRPIYIGGTDSSTPGFIGGARYRDRLWDAVRGIDGYTVRPSNSINYASKHDNFVLWDNLAWTLGPGRFGIGGARLNYNNMEALNAWYRPATALRAACDLPINAGITQPRDARWGDDFINNTDFYVNPFFHIEMQRDALGLDSRYIDTYAVRAQLLAAGIVLTSQGVPFLHSGDEFLRTKRGHRNTFNAYDCYNAINWEQKVRFNQVYEFYSGMVELRRHVPAFRMDDYVSDMSSRFTMVCNRNQQDTLVFSIGEYAGGSTWRNVYVGYNGSASYQEVWLDRPYDLFVVVSTEIGYAGIRSLEVIPAGTTLFTLPPFSMFVAHDTACPVCEHPIDECVCNVTITSRHMLTITENTNRTLNLTARGTDPITFTLGDDAPTGVGIVGNQLLMADTIAVGEHSFTIIAANEEGYYEQTFILHVLPRNINALNFQNPHSLPETPHGGNILHAWNMSFNEIRAQLPYIAEAGFGVIQTSPIGEALEAFPYPLDEDFRYTWWMLYQPTRFRIGNMLGTEEEFRLLTSAAAELGIFVIVDAVPNHTTSWWCQIHEELQHPDLFHAVPGDGSQWDIRINDFYNRMEHTRGRLYDLVDFYTGNPEMQALYTEFLGRIIDAGASGFRFDAMSHVEAPVEHLGDGSDFWPVINSFVRDHVAGLDSLGYGRPHSFQYGEILGPTHRQEIYASQLPADILVTPYMFGNYIRWYGVTRQGYDGNWGTRYNRQGSHLRTGDGQWDSWDTSNFGIPSATTNRVVPWVESHDQFANTGVSTILTGEQIAVGWALIAARAGTTPLFFVRPGAYVPGYRAGNIDNRNHDPALGFVNDGQMFIPNSDGSFSNAWGHSDFFRDPTIAAVNWFANDFINYPERTDTHWGNVAFIERGPAGAGNKLGAVIVNAGTLARTPNGWTTHLADGVYVCDITELEFTVESGGIAGPEIPGRTVLVLRQLDDEEVQYYTLIQVVEGETRANEEHEAQANVTIAPVLPTADGRIFTHWTFEPLNVVFVSGSDAYSASPTFVMPNANVTVTANFEAASVVVAPDLATVLQGGTEEFAATVNSGVIGAGAVQWSVEGSSNPGTFISSVGLLTVAVDEVATTITVVAVCAVTYPEVRGTAVVTVTPFVPASIVVAPALATVQQGDSEEFTAIVTSDAAGVGVVEWSVEGSSNPGTFISSAGLLTVAADEAAVTITVVAVCVVTSPELRGTAVVTITPQGGTVDWGDLGEVIAEAEALFPYEYRYTVASWAEMMAVLRAARAVYANETVSQATVDNVRDMLVMMLEALEIYEPLPAPDFAELNALILSIQELDEADFTPLSWGHLQASLNAAQVVLNNPTATATSIATVVNNLQAMIDALEKQPVSTINRTGLSDAIALAESQIQANYTPLSWGWLTAMLNSARNVMNNPNASQTAIDNATNNLLTAIDMLVPVS